MSGRRRSGRAIHGWINLDKPAGLSSAAAVAAVRRATGAARLGHAGTLDPLATGVLPVALGEATKTMAFAVDMAKRYRFTLVFGETRSTDDAEGEVVAASNVRPGRAEVEAVLGEFIGQISQVPPAYSAIKVAGRRAYAMARAGESVELAARIVRIDALAVVDEAGPDRLVLACASGKGAYMRALARDIAARLGACGHLEALRRTAVGPFTEETAISLASLDEFGHSPALPLLPIETALDGIPALALTDREALRLRCGQAVPVLRTADRERLAAAGDDAIVLAQGSTGPIALVRVDGLQVRPVRVLNL